MYVCPLCVQIPNDYILRGQTQTTTLDHTALHCIQPHRYNDKPHIHRYIYS